MNISKNENPLDIKIHVKEATPVAQSDKENHTQNVAKEIFTTLKSQGSVLKSVHTFSKASSEKSSTQKANLLGANLLKNRDSSEAPTRSRSNAIIKSTSSQEQKSFLPKSQYALADFKMAYADFVSLPNASSFEKLYLKGKDVMDEALKEKSCPYETFKELSDNYKKTLDLLGDKGKALFKKNNPQKWSHFQDGLKQCIETLDKVKITSDFPQANTPGMQKELRTLFTKTFTTSLLRTK